MTTRSRRASPRLVLVSASPRRHDILKGLGVPFIADPSPLPEPERQAGESPQKYSVRTARHKVRSVSGRHRDGLLLGADTVVAVGAKVLGKPKDEEDGRAMLSALSGRWHEVVTGLCLRDAQTNRMAVSHTTTRVRFRNLTSREVKWYLATNEYRDKAGAYAIQGYGALLIDRIDGCYFNIVGFPIVSFEKLLRRMGASVLDYAK